MIKNPYTYMREHPYEIGLIDPDSSVDAIKQLALYEHTGLSPTDIADLLNEHCLLCGNYKAAHLGACDGCRWRKT